MESQFNLINRTIQEFCSSEGLEKNYCIAYSGGLDSHVLLHAFANLRTVMSFNLRAIYVNHGLSPNANTWAQHCANVCASLQIPFQEYLVNAKHAVGESPEEAAREARYTVFAEILAENEILLTAHHQNDQAETVLLQMLRGAGPKGLAAMPRIKSFGKGFLARPFLNFTRDELQAYAQQHQLCWIEDESNANVDFARNFLRQEIFPILKKRWPAVTETLARVADHCAEAQMMLDEISLQDLQAVQGSDLNTLSVKKILELDLARQRQVLRAWLRQLNFPVPPTVKLHQIQQDMLHAREDKSPHFLWNGVELRRYRDRLYAMPELKAHDATQQFEWDLQQKLELPSIGTLHATTTKNKVLHADIEKVTVKFRQGGEMCSLPGRAHRHELKKLFQEWGVLPWLRDRIPLIYVGDKLAAVVGYFVSEEFAEYMFNISGE